MRMKSAGILLTGLVCLWGLLAGVGCGKKEDSASPSPTPAPAANTLASGKSVYAANGCANCHAIGGQGGRSAPDLSHVAAEKQHDAAWLIAHVKNPKSHKPNSRMPGFVGKIADKDLTALGGYLASLK